MNKKTGRLSLFIFGAYSLYLLYNSRKLASAEVRRERLAAAIAVASFDEPYR